MWFSSHQGFDPVALSQFQVASLVDFLHWLDFHVVGLVADFAKVSVESSGTPGLWFSDMSPDFPQMFREPDSEGPGCHMTLGTCKHINVA